VATRFWLLRDGPAVNINLPAPFPYSAWDDTTQVGGNFRMFNRKLSPANTTGPECNIDQGVGGAEFTYLWLQYVSEPLAAQTIAGTCKGQIRVSQDSALSRADQVVSSLKICSGDGATTRGHLLALGPHGTTNDFAGPFGQNRKIADGDALTSTAAQEGDRLVLEVGWEPSLTPDTIESFVCCYVGDDNAGDLPEDETETSQALNPWFELSQDLVFQPALGPLAVEQARGFAERRRDIRGRSARGLARARWDSPTFDFAVAEELEAPGDRMVHGGRRRELRLRPLSRARARAGQEVLVEELVAELDAAGDRLNHAARRAELRGVGSVRFARSLSLGGGAEPPFILVDVLPKHALGEFYKREVWARTGLKVGGRPPWRR